jgi:aromatic-amino-acid transaminase
MLASLEARPTDPLLSLISLLEADPRADKIDLGVGVYRDATGCTPVMAAIKAAETLLVELQDSKSYLGPEGDTGFVDAMAHLAFATVAAGKSYAGLQTPGGTGALRLLLELWLRANPDGTVWLGIPSWPVHETMIRRVGARLQTYIHYDTIAQRPCPDALLAAIHAAKAGDLFLLHGCCHNPSGADPDKAMWQTIGEALSSVGAIALVDLAYQGLGDGLDEDAAGLHILLDHVPELLLAYSCDKNFGLYRDRVGAAYVLCDNAAHLEIAKGHLAEIARSCWSMPPDHGGATVRLVMSDPGLTASWRSELAQMAERIRTIRNRLAQYGNIGKFELGRLRYEKGMFALLPTTPDQVVQLRNEFSVFMVGSGRVNLAGLKETDCDRLVQAISRLD